MMTKARGRWQDIDKVKIDPEEILYLVQEMARRHDENLDMGFESAAFVLFEKYKGRDDIADRAICVTTRMHCLADLMGDERMHGWTMETKDPECTLTNGAVFHAVALCPLHLKNEQYRFDADEFFRIALEEVEPEGHA
jgi:hypothetical protein